MSRCIRAHNSQKDGNDRALQNDECVFSGSEGVLESNCDVYRRNTHPTREIANAARRNSVRWERKSELEHSTNRKSTTVAS